MVTREDLKSRAKDQLRGRWVISIVALLIYSIITSGMLTLSERAGNVGQDGLEMSLNIISLIFSGVITLGTYRFLLNLTTGVKEPELKDLFSGFNIFFKTLGLHLLGVICIAVGFLLLIIPGIIVALMFSQAYYILAEDDSKSITQCLSESTDMMKGYKMDYFILTLSFLGWMFLAILTLGIGFLWLNPYMEVTFTNFYLELKKEKNIIA